MKYKFIFFIAAITLLVAGSCNSNASNDQSESKKLRNAQKENRVFNPLTDAQKAHYQIEIQKKFDSLFPGETFNGEILIAKNGEILFEKYQGYHDFKNKTPITENTALHVASVSKPLTGAAILRLYEEGKLSLDDSVQQFIPDLPYPGITIRNLLSHRSGLPNYLYFMDKDWDKKRMASNQDIINFLTEHKIPRSAAPDRAFQYCNTNYILLALIVEKISGLDFPTYMKKNVFEPLGMNNSYIFSKKDSAHYIETYSVSKPFPMDHYDCSYGDKNVYTTVRDLLKWDNVLYTGDFLKPQTIQLSYEALSHEKPSVHNYGLGWRLINSPAGDTVIYHNGFWHGTNAVFTRFVQDTAVVIIIGNKQNKNIYKGKEFGNIFSKQEKYEIANPLE